MTKHRLASTVAASLSALLWLAGGEANAQGGGSFMTSGGGCPEVTSDSGPVLYGTMPAGAWNLGRANLTFVSDGSNWSLQAEGGFIEPSANATLMSAGDDQILGPLALPFSFPYPGGAGATTAIDVNVNGRVYLEAGTNPWSGGWNANMIRPDFLSATPSICALGVDLNPGAGGILSFETRTVGADRVALITWERVPEYPDAGSNTFQCQLWGTGDVVLSYVETNGACGLQEALVGVSAGGGAPDPGASSLAIPLFLSFSGQPVIGGSFTVGVGGIPHTATSGVLSFGMSALATPMPIFGAPPGCEVLIDQIDMNAPLILLPPDGEVQMNWPYDLSVIGTSVECQAFVMDPAQGTPVPLIVSDRGTLTFGAPPALAFVIEGPNSYKGSPEQGGFCRLESSPGATHPDIVGLEVSFIGMQPYFDVEGNAGVEGQGFFNDGNGTGARCRNAYYGTDVQTGLVYGGGLQPAASCDKTGTTGWVGSLPVGGSASRFQRLEFEFTDFSAGELFGFDCDTDGGDFNAGAQLLSVTVTFSDSTSLTQLVQYESDNRAVGVLIP